jgi:hypothetical protein
VPTVRSFGITIICGGDDLEPTTQNFIAPAKEIGRKYLKE